MRPSRRLVLILLVLCGVMETRAQERAHSGRFDLREALEDDRVLGLFADLAWNATRRGGSVEAAAFLIADPERGMECRIWPHSAAKRRESFRGVIPPGTVAIVHTHPNGIPRPSRADVAEAKRIGLPIYVLSRIDIWAVNSADGAEVPLVERKNWIAKARRQSTARCESP